MDKIWLCNYPFIKMVFLRQLHILLTCLSKSDVDKYTVTKT